MIKVDDLTVRYGATEVISGLDLHVAKGEFVTLLGSSGCGKSTLLRTVAGFVPAAAGAVIIDGQDVTRIPPEDRGVGLVFQSYALFPHLDVGKNVAFGLRVKRLSSREVAQRVDEVLETTGLTHFKKAMPADLSGGQQQRVAIARVLVTGPTVILMDEPLSNLDAAMRITLRAEISRLHRELGMTTLYVTHDQQEALALSDRVAVMRNGAFEQVASPDAVYHRPATSYVCEFVGSANRLNDPLSAAFGLPAGDEVRYVRPERIQIGRDLDAGVRATGVVRERSFLGTITHYTVAIADSDIGIMTVSEPGDPIQVGDRVSCGFDAVDVIEVPR
ncbi:MAG: ABC transporter ATP-binding protein [Propionibacteriaceae bacterium]|nr:ABC transporter ATP-binding protein [Propionibacteriaceae bacterium]